jgi:hypothetical protein
MYRILIILVLCFISFFGCSQKQDKKESLELMSLKYHYFVYNNSTKELINLVDSKEFILRTELSTGLNTSLLDSVDGAWDDFYISYINMSLSIGRKGINKKEYFSSSDSNLVFSHVLLDGKSMKLVNKTFGIEYLFLKVNDSWKIIKTTYLDNYDSRKMNTYYRDYGYKIKMKSLE